MINSVARKCIKSKWVSSFPPTLALYAIMSHTILCENLLPGQAKTKEKQRSQMMSFNIDQLYKIEDLQGFGMEELNMKVLKQYTKDPTQSRYFR